MKTFGWWWQVLGVMVSAIGVIALSGLLYWQIYVLGLASPFGPVVPLLAGILVLLGILWFGIIIHEMGHLTAGLAMGFRVFLVILGPVKFVREGGRFRFRINWRSAAPGYVSMVPTDEHDLRRRMLILVMGGPLANLLAGVLFLLAALAWNGPPLLYLQSGRLADILPGSCPWLPQNHVAAFLTIAGILNLMFGLYNLIPQTVNKLVTDGGRILSLWRGDGTALRELLVLALSASSLSGIRARDWDRTLLAQLRAARNNEAIDVAADMFGYYHALDSGAIEEAGDLLDRALEERKNSSADFRPIVLWEAVYFEAWHRQDRHAAQVFLRLAQRRTGNVDKLTCLRAEAALHFAEGQYAEAAAQAQAALALLPDSVDRGGTVAEGEWLNQLLRECQERLHRP